MPIDTTPAQSFLQSYGQVENLRRQRDMDQLQKAQTQAEIDYKNAMTQNQQDAQDLAEQKFEYEKDPNSPPNVRAAAAAKQADTAASRAEAYENYQLDTAKQKRLADLQKEWAGGSPISTLVIGLKPDEKDAFKQGVMDTARQAYNAKLSEAIQRNKSGIINSQAADANSPSSQPAPSPGQVTPNPSDPFNLNALFTGTMPQANPAAPAVGAATPPPTAKTDAEIEAEAAYKAHQEVGPEPDENAWMSMEHPKFTEDKANKTAARELMAARELLANNQAARQKVLTDTLPGYRQAQEDRMKAQSAAQVERNRIYNANSQWKETFQTEQNSIRRDSNAIARLRATIQGEHYQNADANAANQVAISGVRANNDAAIKQADQARLMAQNLWRAGNSEAKALQSELSGLQKKKEQWGAFQPQVGPDGKMYTVDANGNQAQVFPGSPVPGLGGMTYQQVSKAMAGIDAELDTRNPNSLASKYNTSIEGQNTLRDLFDPTVTPGPQLQTVKGDGVVVRPQNTKSPATKSPATPTAEPPRPPNVPAGYTFKVNGPRGTGWYRQ